MYAISVGEGDGSGGSCDGVRLWVLGGEEPWLMGCREEERGGNWGLVIMGSKESGRPGVGTRSGLLEVEVESKIARPRPGGGARRKERA